MVQWRLRVALLLLLSGFLLFFFVSLRLWERQDAQIHSMAYDVLAKEMKMMDSERTAWYYLNHSCPCSRLGIELKKDFNNGIQSTCSDFSTQRGSNQQVISYAYYNPSTNYGKDDFHTEKYLKSLNDRANEIRDKYPDWLMRIYHNISYQDLLGQGVLCDMFCKHQHVDLCDVTNLPVIGNRYGKGAGFLWRFIVMGDSTVSIFNCRDSDSLIQQRELDAVNEWLELDLTFHVMRDHPHHRAPILAGLWGAKNWKNLSLMTTLRNEIFSDMENHKYGYDQYLLATKVWPVAKKDVLQHDSFTCKEKFHTNSVPFPTKRETDLYVGWGPFAKETSLEQFRGTPCPLECRPPLHLDWERC